MLESTPTSNQYSESDSSDNSTEEEDRQSRKHKKSKKKSRRSKSTGDTNNSRDDSSDDDDDDSDNSDTPRKKSKKKKKKKKHHKKDKKKKRESKRHEKRMSRSNGTSPPLTPSPQPPQTTSTTKTTPSIAVPASNTLFRRQKIKFEVSLPPHCLSDIRSSINNSVQSLLLRYDDGIGGVLLAYWNVSLENDTGRILNELPHMHFDVTADGLVFCPAKGMKVKGLVNECFPSHVGILVHSYFNAMISSNCLRSAGYEFDMERSEWISNDSSTKKGVMEIQNGNDIHFLIDRVHECGGLVSLEGTL